MRYERIARAGMTEGAGTGQRVRRLTAGCLAVLAAAGSSPGQSPPAAEIVTVGSSAHALAVARHHGFPSVRWGDWPPGLLEDAFLAGSTGTARVGGQPLRLSAGSPFGSHGASVFQLVNLPYLHEGDLWVPVELITEWLPAVAPQAMASRGESPGSATGGPVDRPPAPASRRPGAWRVVIDAGHGGHDPGTISPRTGAREKDITLRVARYLREALGERPGIEPLMIRDDDRFINVTRRPSLAMAMHADLFLSIHVNAEPRRRTTAGGFETYYLGRARTEEARRVAMRENAVIELDAAQQRPNLEQVEFILAGLDQDVNLGESRRFAGYVQNGLRRVFRGKDRGVKAGPFYVLLTTGDTPTVLVELGFITNRADEEQLTSESVQRSIANALAGTIESYFEETGRRIAVMEGRD